MLKVEQEFRASVVQGSAGIRSRLAAWPAESQPSLPGDARKLTRGTRSTLRWSEAPPGLQDLQADRLNLSGNPQPSAAYPRDPDLSEAQRTLTELLAALQSKGLSNHPRARALSALRNRLPTLDPAASTPAREPAADTWQTLRDEAADFWEAVLGAVQGPAGRTDRRRRLLAKADQASQRGDAAQERKFLRRILVSDPADPIAHFRLGRRYLQSGQLDQAEPHIGAAAAALPKDPEAQLALGQLHYHRKDPEAAIVAFGQALRLNPDHSDANAWLGILAFDAQRPVEAQRFLERAIALDPTHAVARYYVAQLSLANGDSLRADFHLSLVRKLEPGADLTRFAQTPQSLAQGSRSKAYNGWKLPIATTMTSRPSA
ncbi:MAG: tetratricopeptide repeat protein [Cyanobacteria bacterium REEB65]|nr:tetratricopeptide repeat protein [Cyanobacteria bacterium REEB65]